MNLKGTYLIKFATGVVLFVIILLTPGCDIADKYKNNWFPPSHTGHAYLVGELVPKAARPSLRDSIVNFASSLLGTDYVEGACSKEGFDCSGFVYYVFTHFNIKVPRSSSEYKDFGREVLIDSAKKGDVLVFLSPTRNVIGHVGLVLHPKGKETDFIHASSGKQKKVVISSLKEEHYARRFVKAVRIVEN